MGCFSWMYADNTEKNILIDGDKFTLLFPDGRRWTNDKYDGYGHIKNPVNNAEVDVYALLAVWNRELIIKDKDFKKEHALKNEVVNVRRSIIDDYYDLSIPDDVFVDKVESGDIDYTECLRSLGITFDCTQFLRQLENFKPLKFVEDDRLSYDDVDASDDDPNQGMQPVEEEVIGYCDYCGEEIHENDWYIEDDNGLLYCCESCRDAANPDYENFDEDAWEDEYYGSNDED